MTKALRDRLNRLRRERSGRTLVDELNEIAEHCAALPVVDRRDDFVHTDVNPAANFHG